MALTTKQLKRRSNLKSWPWLGWVLAAVELAAVYLFAWRGSLWVLAAAIIVVVELRSLLPGREALASSERRARLWQAVPGLMLGLSVTLIVAMVPRHITQVVVTLLYGAWLVWREREPGRGSDKLVHLLIVQAAMFEAIFLMAAVWQVPGWIILLLVWIGSYLGVYSMLTKRGDRSAGVMAATWGVIATEVSWVLLLWLITYTMRGGYVLVPQPALILTALAYVFGSILASSREGKLSRMRLGEYLVIGFVLVVIVVVDSLLRSNS